MVVTVSLWLALFAILFGVGSGALRCAGRTIDSGEDVFTAFWLGWAFTVAILQVWHLFAPVGAPSFGAIGFLGAIGFYGNRGAIASGCARFRRQWTDRPLLAGLLIVFSSVFVLWLSNRAMGPITPKGDAGLYHITTIRWIQNYAVVPGLGNLDGRLVFNNSSFLFLGMLDLVPGPPHFYHLGNPLLILVFSAQSFLYLGQLVQQRERVDGHRLLGCLWLAGIVPYYFMEFPSTSTDIVNLILGLLLGTHLFKIVFQTLSLRDLGFHTVLVILLAAIGISNKLSFAFLGTTASAVAVWRFCERVIDADYREALRRIHPFRSAVFATGLLCLAILVPWVIRGVITSGYIAFPSNTFLSFDVDWRVPEADLNLENRLIRIIARSPGDRSPEVLDNWDWFFPWLGTTAQRADIITVPLLLFAVMSIAYANRNRKKRQNTGAMLTFLAPPAVAMTLWFLTAPAERFAGGVFWLLGAGMAAIYFQQAPSKDSKRRLANRYLAFIAATVTLSLVVSTLFSQQRYGWALFVSPGPENGFHPIPMVETAEYSTDSGLELNVPQRVATPTSNWNPAPFCWDAPLPCTRRPRKTLELRKPGDLSSGFRSRSPG